MCAYQVSPDVAVAISKLTSSSNALISEEVVRDLQRYKLIMNENACLGATATGTELNNKERSSHSLSSITLLLIQKCNMKCIYCYGNSGEFANRGVMDSQVAFRSVDWLFENSINSSKININFFGGEPLLNFALIKKVVFYAKNKALVSGKNISFGMTTNGSIISEEILDFIANENIDILISFDGTREYQNANRPFADGVGSYEKVYSNIQVFRSKLPNLTARATVNEIMDPFLVKKGIKNAGFIGSHISRVSPVLLGKAAASTTENTPDFDFEKKFFSFNCSEVDELFLLIRRKEIYSSCPPQLLMDLAVLSLERKRYYGCGVGKEMVAISINGDVYPCHRFVGMNEFCLGNIFENIGIKNNSYHRASVDSLQDCRYCWARYICGGGCVYCNMVYAADPFRPYSVECNSKKALYEKIIHHYCQLTDSDREYLKDIFNEIKPER